MTTVVVETFLEKTCKIFTHAFSLDINDDIFEHDVLKNLDLKLVGKY